jgi:hypothetical protein
MGLSPKDTVGGKSARLYPSATWMLAVNQKASGPIWSQPAA